jgi:hypothetical protein
LKSSIVLTTNRPVGSWEEILGDTTVAAHCSIGCCTAAWVLTLDGESYRCATTTPPPAASAGQPPETNR